MSVIPNWIHDLPKAAAIVHWDGHRAAFAAVNEPYCRMIGYSEEECLGKNPADLLNGESRRLLINLIRRMQAQRQMYAELTQITATGTEIDTRVDGSLLRSDGSGRLYLILCEDISACKWIERELSAGQARSSGICDPEFRIQRFDTYHQPAIAGARRYIDAPLFDFIAPDDRGKLLRLLDEAIELGCEQEQQLRTARFADLFDVAVKVRVRAFFDGYGRLLRYAFVIRDLQPYEEADDPGIRLKTLMAQRNMSASQLSEATGLSPQTISKLRSGKIRTPQRLTAELIAAELGVSPSRVWSKTRN
ncbi:PAS domain S-box protein [Paenibacillus thermoaerophilus]|uniref:PAS domain S-box protein n=1 Tax=Paenibacillus thermoaerophilus TaxID=1215385 RepID=A0ABW2V2B6_9BACL|nr:PAS domain S-box protein [Paenibacillus thermoaerophilus]TMV18289.1 helix-turn-helix domain-containing protein [Paenibacillus thermoaerophilus]